MPDGEFRELNTMAFDDKPFYRELIDDEHGTNIYDEAIDPHCALARFRD